MSIVFVEVCCHTNQPDIIMGKGWSRWGTAVALTALVVGGLSALLVQAGSNERFGAEMKHVLKPTEPVEPEFKRPEDDREEVYSAAHCFSENMQSYSWRSNACFLKNLCFETETREFVFFAKDKAAIPLNISIGTFNYVRYPCNVVGRLLVQFGVAAVVSLK